MLHNNEISPVATTRLTEMIQEESVYFQQVAFEMSKVIVGNEQVIDALLTAILCNGHVLLEGVPGVAKTTMVKILAEVLGLEYKRIQFTPDLLPADLIGTLVYNQKTQEFDTKKGPLFATNFVLADEINRAPSKVQSALLEAMQEGQVTIGNTTYALEKTFFVFATQNPLEQEGTYRLPEAQLDRFLVKLLISYPTIAQEKELISIRRTTSTILPIINQQKIATAQQIVKEVYVDDRIIDYILAIVSMLRYPQKHAYLKNYITCGPSPRATIALYHMAQANAFRKKRHFVIPDDIKEAAHNVLRHRIILSYIAEAENITTDQLITQVLTEIKAP